MNPTGPARFDHPLPCLPLPSAKIDNPMAEVIRMPKMSDTMTEGVIVAWHKKVGDKVKPGDVVAEIETDKAVMEFESFQEGTLLYIGVEKGKAVKVDEVIAVLGKEGEDYQSLLQSNGATTREEAKQESPAPKITPGGKKEPVAPPAPPVQEAGRIKASPLAKKIAQDAGIPIAQVKGSGDEGRIVKRDVERFMTEKPSAPFVPAVAGEERFEEIPVSQMRKAIARRLAESKFSAPHFYLTMEANMDRCVEARAAINEVNPERKISFNDIVIKSVALALKKHPQVNSSWLGETIRIHHHVHIGMAVAVTEGLLVPVIRFADQKSLSQINEEAKALAAKAKEKKLQPDEMQGNTFTISNLGMMEIDEFTAIINPPDACILAVGRIAKVPAVINNEVKVASMMKLTLSCDHRVVDGATGARFLQTLKSYLENPLSMLY
jgi:pyruvate dehydrogenase E2 component (dihydrolipoamide acetyltransferase)